MYQTQEGGAMPTAKKLPSGSYRCQVFAGYDYIDGKKKRKYESFTAPTKREAEAMAAKWNQDRKQRPEDITVEEALKKYIASKENVLSPSTVRVYEVMLPRFESIQGKKLRSLKQADVQMMISENAAKYKPKTVANTYGLFTAALDMFAPGLTFKVTLPAKMKPEVRFATDDDLKKLLDHVSGSTLWIAIMLARYYSLRRGEICGLKSDDLDGNILTIRRVKILDKNNKWVIKETPKTYTSYRYLIIDDPLLSELKKCDGYIIDCTPTSLYRRYKKAIQEIGMEDVTFHMLRHMFATRAAMEGIPDFFTAQIGGWSPGSSVLKQVYQNAQSDDLKKQMLKLNKSMQHEMQHGDSENKENP